MSRFKTELCNNLIELGVCKYGDRCHYAHGAHELRQVSRRHPKYRTEKCKNFELTGRCPFGPRCSYVHPKPDLDSMIEQLTRYVQHTKAPEPDSEAPSTTLTIQRPQQPKRIAMRALSSNTQSQIQDQREAFNNCTKSSSPLSSLSSYPSSPSPPSLNCTITASNPFGLNNPFSDYFNTTPINDSDENQVFPNKKFFTRF